MTETTVASTRCPIRRTRESTRLRTLLFLILVVFPAFVCVKATSGASIYRDTEPQSPPCECFKSVRPSYLVDETEKAYQLIVDIPYQVPRKNLNVDIDYDEGFIEVFGWWMEQKIRGEKPKKMCIYRKWTVEPKLEEEGSPVSSISGIYLHTIVMEMKDRRLTVSLPRPEEKASMENNDQDEVYQEDPVLTVTSSVHLLPIKIAEAARKLRGLARLGTTQNSTVMARVEDKELLMNEDSAKVSVYQKSRQDALERFLMFSLGSNDEDSYWLRHM